MAFPTTYVNGRTIKDALDGTITLNLNTDSIKVALFTNSVTGADANASESYGSGAWATTNEVTSSGYTAGGLALSDPSLTTPTAGSFTLDDTASNLTWTGVTFTTRGALIYDVTASNRVLGAINFGENKVLVAGTFTLTWDSTNNILKWTF